MSGGSCEIHPRAAYVVLGKTQYDQDWIDETIAVNTSVCGHDKPKPRPTSFDEPSRGSTVDTAPEPPRKPSLWQRAKTRVQRRGRPTAGTVAPIPAARPTPAVATPAAPERADPIPAAVTPPEPEPKPCSPVDQLLRNC